ncbi:DNA polymerase III subunit delta' [Paenisporosarcina cavernae]|uniref:DNA polymerase III subunit delta n=1 Tax=Paenisporosarcina cavernae TaxID=2320858 RepID=A0A385YVZ4_9BACL|nr:DNA polymerase III subunit delta' [Paenisporosarcina cavernae]AYC30714.1 DNA polymerase III subunit delta' [Paenisporosarcina cavernae]
MKWKQAQPIVYKQLLTTVEKNRIGHAYLFEGPKGVGKVDAMEFFVQAMVCENKTSGEPCGKCRACIRVANRNDTNFVEVFPDGQQIKIDQIRDLLAEMAKTGMEDGRKIYVIHEADRMNISASNTLLKFLEEPTTEITAILITEKLASILPTIRSRTQIISFKPGSPEMIRHFLENESIPLPLASTASYMTNDAEKAFALAKDEQFAQRRKTVLKLVKAVEAHVQEGLLFVQEEFLPTFKEKADVEEGLDLLLLAYRDLVAVKVNPDSDCAYPEMRSFYQDRALMLSYEQVSKKLEAILQARTNVPRNMNRNLLMEQLVLNLQEGYTFV